MGEKLEESWRNEMVVAWAPASAHMGWHGISAAKRCFGGGDKIAKTFETLFDSRRNYFPFRNKKELFLI